MKTDFLSLHGFSAEARHLSFEERVRLVRIETFFGHAAGNMAGIAIATLLFAYILFSAGVTTSVWFGWAAFVLTVTAALAVFDYRIKQRGLTQENAPGFLRQRVIFGVVVGMSCAFGALLVPLDAAPDAAAAHALWLARHHRVEALAGLGRLDLARRELSTLSPGYDWPAMARARLAVAQGAAKG